jgi:putative membrane protein
MATAQRCRMTSLWNPKVILMVTALSFGLASACSSDDDDDDTSSGNGGDSASGAPATTSGAPNMAGSLNHSGAPSGQGGENAAGTGGALVTDTGGQGGDVSGAIGQGGQSGGAGGDGATSSISDAQILLLLDTLNQGEVEEAYAALPRLSSPDVQAFAQQMITDHGSARQSIASTAEALALNPAPSKQQKKLEAEAEVHVAALRNTPADELDAAYVELQVAAHVEALELLARLREKAEAPALTTLIDTLETAVDDHHESAVALQSELE